MSIEDVDQPPGDVIPTPPGDRLARLFGDAREGSRSSVGRLLNACRDYLMLVANKELSSDVRQKVAASDVVQDSILEAYQGFDSFRGQDENDLLVWLRCIVRNNVIDVTRSLRGTEKRDISRERQLSAKGDERLWELLPGDDPSPSSKAVAAEEQRALTEAMLCLPESQAQVIQLRNLQYLSFVEIGNRLGLSDDAARKLWQRAIDHLARILKQRHVNTPPH